MKLPQILLEYCKADLKLFPVNAETKLPAIKNMLNAASSDPKQLRAWAAQFPKCNWGLSLAKSGLVCVDVDDKHDGLKKWSDLILEHGDPETRRQQSGSGKGFHYVFKADFGVRYKGKITAGIDVKHNGFIVVAPSVHESGNQYKWLNQNDFQPLPEWLKERIEKRRKKEAKLDGVALPHGFFKETIDKLREVPFGYEEWVSLGMALHEHFGGNSEGLALFVHLTEGVNFEPGDVEVATDKWNSFESKDGNLGVGTFIHICRQLGVEVPKSIDEDKELFKQAQKAQMRKDEATKGWIVNERTHSRFSTDAEFIIEQINSDGYAMLSGDNEGKLIRVYEQDHFRKAKMLSTEDFKNTIRDRAFKFWSATGPQFKPASDLWLSAGTKKRYERIVFTPESEARDGELNLWTGLPIEPVQCDPKELEPYLEFVHEVIASADRRRADYLLDWAAHRFQKPFEKCSIVPTLIGPQGTGKGLFAEQFRLILLDYFLKVSSSRVFKERFNAEQARKILTFLDEASWRGDKEEAGILKDLTGNEYMTVEEKFGARFNIRNPSAYMIASNNFDAIAVEHANRRYLVCETNEKYLGNKAFYKELWSLMRKPDFANKLLWFYLQRDISAFAPTYFPNELDNQGLETKLGGRGAVALFWFDTLFENPAPIFHKGVFLSKAAVYAHFLDWLKDSRHWARGYSVQMFWRETLVLIPVLKARSRETRSLVNGFDKRARLIRAYPFEVAESFCRTLNVEVPEDFNDLDGIVESEFQPIAEVNA